MSKSVSKLTSTANPRPLRTPKTRLTKGMRDILYRYMGDQLVERLDRTEVEATLLELVEKTNLILRDKYPEADMPVLRKYEMVRIDSCLRFTLADTGRVFGVDFHQPGVLRIEAKLADIPYRRGCYNTDVYPCDAAFESLADRWEKQMNERSLLISERKREYDGFLLACRYLEDIEAVVPLTEEIRNKLGAQSRSLTIISADVLSSIRSDFAQGAAA
jgi:hypothetical protein